MGFLAEHLRRQKSILLLTIILYTTIMSTVTSDTPIAKIPQTSGMRKNGEFFLLLAIALPPFSSPLAPFLLQAVHYSDTLTDRFPGKQWHETKKAFRPTAGQTSYAKRQAKDQALAVVKAQEKEMKEEKEAERQVRRTEMLQLDIATDTRTETHHSTQGEARGKGREGALREDGSQDAPEESRQTEAQREEK